MTTTPSRSAIPGLPAPRIAAELGLDPRRSAAAWCAIQSILEVSVDPPRQGQLLNACAAMLDLGNTPDTQLPLDELHAIFPDDAERRALVHALVVAACVGGAVTKEAQWRVNSIAGALEAQTRWVDLLDAMRRKSVFTIKRTLARSAPDARRLLSRTWQEEGVAGIGRALLFVAGLHRDRELARRFCDLEGLPTDSLGSRFFHHIRSRGLAFPGEKGGVPERMVHHDLMHVLTGYDTDGPGECELAGFYAGFSDGDSFTFIVIALATFQLGLAVSPSAVTATVNAFDIERVARAYVRGRRVCVDVMGPWDYWRLMPLRLSEARREVGIDAGE
jgi:hypothetical protein